MQEEVAEAAGQHVVQVKVMGAQVEAAEGVGVQVYVVDQVEDVEGQVNSVEGEVDSM